MFITEKKVILFLKELGRNEYSIFPKDETSNDVIKYLKTIGFVDTLDNEFGGHHIRVTATAQCKQYIEKNDLGL